MITSWYVSEKVTHMYMVTSRTCAWRLPSNKNSDWSSYCMHVVLCGGACCKVYILQAHALHDRYIHMCAANNTLSTDIRATLM